MRGGIKNLTDRSKKECPEVMQIQYQVRGATGSEVDKDFRSVTFSFFGFLAAAFSKDLHRAY